VTITSPLSELIEIAAANQDDETFELLAALKVRRFA
jgi:ferritin